MEAIISYHFTTSSRKESDSFSRVVVVKDVTTALKNRGKANIRITKGKNIGIFLESAIISILFKKYFIGIIRILMLFFHQIPH